MKVSSSVLVLAAALGASARPSGHAHQQAHNVRRDFVVANKPVTITQYATQVVGATAATDVPDAVYEAATPKTSSGSSSGSGSGYKEFCGGKKSKRATAEEIAYEGNTGTEDDFGCNMMTVDSSVADKYKYTATFKNAGSEEQECVCFNKIGPDGLINGFWSGNEAIKFSVAAKGSQVVAFDENTQGGCACGAGEVPLTAIGQFASTWLELDVGNVSNKKWSGADASCLVSAAENLDIPGLKVCGHGTCSTINPGGTGENAYLGGMEAEDGVGLNLAPGKVRLEVIVDYKG
ncbi:allergen asp f 4 [Fusarium albosuccineum]|uniref:Allergen asp f 4 n=1 Tax=Fusarium albosuccineum TaxID=1237068 RepID=A0A8H4LRB2_9HYPO|nr:allergen asp f 4 [Fusarium albosuccineum]